MTLAMWILTTGITVLLGVVAFFLKRLIDNIDKLNTTINGVISNMQLYNYKTDENEAKITVTNAEIIDLKDRLKLIEVEHKNRKCNEFNRKFHT